jgi:hypothetical protein
MLDDLRAKAALYRNRAVAASNTKEREILMAIAAQSVALAAELETRSRAQAGGPHNM